MRYTGPKFKLCRREQVNLFGSAKYDVRKRRSLPGQHGSSMKRNSEYGKLLRNKQVLKRSYGLSEKQFSRLVQKLSAKYAKNNDVSHDAALFIFLESRMDSILYRSGIAKTMMQARQMASHGHFLLNGKKHNVPSTILKVGDKITLKPKLKDSGLYAGASVDKSLKIPSWIKVDRNKYEVEVISLPKLGEIGVLADILKVIEFYARA
ncbi:MAG TPA: 30S ribosomal protein S4 [Candidatus Absconditabacterales bacterium]|nr:30S ribosomal protein S4 [Candidatus Absconditabacterales bacterium]